MQFNMAGCASDMATSLQGIVGVLKYVSHRQQLKIYILEENFPHYPMLRTARSVRLTHYWLQQVAQVLLPFPDIIEARGCRSEGLGQGAGSGAGQGPYGLCLPGEALHEGMPGLRAHQAHADG